MADNSDAWRIAPMLGFRDVRKAVDYYCDTFGFSNPGGVFDGVGDEGAVYGIVRRDGIEIHLQIRRSDPLPDGRESIEGDVYVFVPDVEALYEELRSLGARVFRPLRDEPYGLRDFTVEDLEGHRITFGQPI